MGEFKLYLFDERCFVASITTLGVFILTNYQKRCSRDHTNHHATIYMLFMCNFSIQSARDDIVRPLPLYENMRLSLSKYSLSGMAVMVWL